MTRSSTFTHRLASSDATEAIANPITQKAIYYGIPEKQIPLFVGDVVAGELDVKEKMAALKAAAHQQVSRPSLR
jgi:hypothetical protein